MKYAVTGKDIPQEQELFNSLWAILKRYYLITSDSESDTYWESLIKEANTLYEALPANTPLAKFGKDLIISELEYIDKLSRERK